METNSQHYTKIEINGDQRNLPEDGSNIFIHFVESNRGAYIEEFKRPDHKENLDLFLKEVDYYLLPVPEPQQPEQPESAIQKAIQFIKENPYQDDFVNRCYRLTNQEGGDNTIESAGYWREQFDIVIDFISQSHNNTVVGVSETEIEKEANWRFTDGHGVRNDFEYYQFIEHAKWALSQCKAIDLRTTLIKFTNKFIMETGMGASIEAFADEFLKSPENK